MNCILKLLQVIFISYDAFSKIEMKQIYSQDTKVPLASKEDFPSGIYTHSL